MHPTTADTEESLAVFWRRFARRATDAQLALCAAAFPIGLAGALVITFTRPHWAVRWWPVIAFPLLVGAFGLWGIGDRERESSRSAVWRAVQSLAVLIAMLSAAVLILWFLQRVIGPWTL